ncbi:MAG: prefoldin subunit alpha [Candidatus Micrarchaeota archaeon]
MAQNNEENLTRLAYEAQGYQQQAQVIQQQIASIQMSINEIAATLGTVKNLDKVKDNSVLLPLGAGAYANGKLTDTSNVLINIGSDVMTEKPVIEVTEILEERMKRLEGMRDKLQSAYLEVTKRLEQLDSEATTLMEKRGGKQ